jgi:NADH dehydrogenase
MMPLKCVLLKNLEKAAICKDTRERRKLLTIVVAGGGPTGVEVSGMYAEMRKSIFQKNNPEIRIRQVISILSMEEMLYCTYE